MTDPVLEWEFHPWRDEPARAWGAAAAVAVCAGLLALAALPVALAAILLLVMALALEPALLASRFRVDDEGFSRVTRLGEARLPWSAARRWRRYRYGIEVARAGLDWLPGSGRRLRLDVPRAEFERIVADLDARRATHGS